MFDNAPADDPRGPGEPRNREIVADEAGWLNRPRVTGEHPTGGAPANRLDPRVIPIWQVESAIESTFLVGFATVGAGIAWWAGLPGWLVILAMIVIVALGVANVLAVPRRRYETWRYEIGEAEVDLQQGFVTVTRTRVPIARIQHVDTRRGPLERRRNLATLVLYTAAGARAIPGLELATAEQARDRIAALANVRDDV